MKKADIKVGEAYVVTKSEREFTGLGANSWAGPQYRGEVLGKDVEKEVKLSKWGRESSRFVKGYLVRLTHVIERDKAGYLSIRDEPAPTELILPSGRCIHMPWGSVPDRVKAINERLRINRKERKEREEAVSRLRELLKKVGIEYSGAGMEHVVIRDTDDLNRLASILESATKE